MYIYYIENIKCYRSNYINKNKKDMLVYLFLEPVQMSPLTKCSSSLKF